MESIVGRGLETGESNQGIALITRYVLDLANKHVSLTSHISIWKSILTNHLAKSYLPFSFEGL